MQNLLLIILFLLISTLCSTVGLGGRNYYIVLLCLFGVPIYEATVISLLCNVLVVSCSCFIFLNNSLFTFKRILPLVLFCIPFSFLGHYMNIKLNKEIVVFILGLNLIVLSIVLYKKWKIKYINSTTDTISKPNYIRDGFIGGYIGFLSSTLGIGGGIFLLSFLYFRNWDNSKKIAATVSLFVLANSMCTLIEQIEFKQLTINYPRFLPLFLAVAVGAQIGARLSVYKLSNSSIRKITAFLIFVAGIEVLTRHLLIK